MTYPPPQMSPVETAHSLLCLSEYAHSLDSLPIDLSRSFGDLRELDAVLSSSMAALTSKINDLVALIETNAGSNDERLYLLVEIADEAARLKLGGEDKIRVASHAADGLRAHRAHSRALLDAAPDRAFAALAEALARSTVYPHVASRAFYPPGMNGDGSRRNRRAAGAGAGAAYGQLFANGDAASPAKKRRVARDEDVDVTRTPSKKDRVDGAPAQRQRNGGRRKCVIIALIPPFLFVSSPMRACATRAIRGHLRIHSCRTPACNAKLVCFSRNLSGEHASRYVCT